MSRYNIFYQVHKGLRAMLYETAIDIQRTDFWNIDEAMNTLNQLETVLHSFEKHAATEDTIVFPAVAKYEPSVADSFEQEHHTDHELGMKMRSAIDEYNNAATIVCKAAVAGKISRAYVEFLVFNLEHMAKEESLMNEILWRYYSDHELQLLTKEIVSKIPPAEMAEFSKWFFRALSNNEIIGWLKDVKANASSFVYHSLLTIAEKELSNARFEMIAEVVGEMKLVA